MTIPNPADEMCRESMGVWIGITKIALASLVAFLAIAGWGRLVRSYFGSNEQNFENRLDDFWIGLATVLCFLQIWHLVLPVNWIASLLVALVGIGSLIGTRARIGVTREVVLFLLLCSPVLLRVAYHSLLPPSHYDSGLYHFNTIRWHMEYPIVPGLANLHGRLGFNLSFLLYAALLNVYPLFNHGHHIATSLLVSVLFLQLALATWRLLRNRPVPTMPLLVRVCLLPVLIGVAFYSPISNVIYYTPSSPALDVPLFIWGIVLFLKFVDYLFGQPSEQPQNHSLFELFALAAVGLSMKLTMLVFAGSVVLIVTAVGLHRSAARGKTARQTIAYSATIALLVMCPWLVRGFVVSGYPAYPSTFGGIDVDWRVPEKQAQLMKKAIWKKTDLMPDPPDWVSTWLKAHAARPMFAWPLKLLVVSLIVLACTLKTAKLGLLHFLAWLPPCAAAVFWFSTSPNPRFVGAALWLAALWPFAGTLKVVLSWLAPPKLFLACGALAAVQVALILSPLMARSPHYAGTIPKGGFCKIPTAALKEYRTRSNLLIWVPQTRDQTWDAPLPATPYPFRRPEARGPTLAHGFRFDPAPAPTTNQPAAGTGVLTGTSGATKETLESRPKGIATPALERHEKR